VSGRVSSELLLWAGMLLLVVGVIVCIAILLLDPESAVRRRYRAYVLSLDRECRFLFLKTGGAQIGRYQLFVTAGVLILPLPFVTFEDPFDLVFIAAALAAVWMMPPMRLRGMHVKRVQKIETQIDGWLLLLANQLRATPSLGEGIAASARLTRAPLGQELDLLLKEQQLGTPLDQALLGMASRVGSRSLAGALATILVGRQTGGDLPRILESSAATLREMARLEGVVRTKTAEGKAQAYVLAAIPFLLVLAVWYIDDAWLAPLATTTTGGLVIVVALVLWVGAIFWARRILAVDI
jgi:tight adherence protein B